MADQPNRPHRRIDDPNPSALDEPYVITDDSVVTMSVRRSPKYAVFIIAGGALGVLIALILTVTVGTPGAATAGGAVYSQPQVFGFLALICGAAGVVIAGVIALVLDRVLSTRTHEVRAGHERAQNFG